MPSYIPSWSQLNISIECDSFYLEEDDDTERLYGINVLQVSSLTYNLSLLCPHNSIASGEQFWVVYKPDFSISTWFPEKPDELSQSGIIKIELTEVSEQPYCQTSFVQFFVKAKILKTLPFSAIADLFAPISSGEPYQLMKNTMSSYLTHSIDLVKGLSEQKEINPYLNLPSPCCQISSGDLISIEFIYPPTDIGGWIVVQQRPECEYPVLVAYTEMGRNPFTFIGNRPLAADEWLFFERWQHQMLELDRAVRQMVQRFDR